MKTSPAALFAILLSTVATASIAQTAPERTGDHHAEPEPVIVITALQRDRDDFLGGVSVLSDTDLAAAKRPTIGETLAGLPGVSATSFGPSASRPILRGFQGDRIRVLTDGIGSFDASTSSVDHAVAINPLLAERVEVIRGPAALLYGSSAIGGVVNVFDSRIPRSIPDEGFHIEADLDYGTAANERRGAAIAEARVADNFVVHVDGSYSKSDDLRTGGYILSPPLRAEAAESDDPETAEFATLRGEIPNTAARSWEVGGGAALIMEGGNLGFSVSRFESLYGIPQRFEVGHDHEEEGEDHEEHAHEEVKIDLRQTRFDLRGEIEPESGFLERIRLRTGYADYRHDEIEGEGEIGTSFFNKGLEGRLEFVQRRQGVWSGAFGGQFFARDFTIVGDEAFLPPTSTEQTGLFAVQNIDFGGIRAEVGGRFEHTDLAATASDVLGTPDRDREYDAFSASGGASVGLVDRWRLGINLSHTERAPTVEELFSNGPHLATQSFEIGDPTLAKERSNGGELTLRGRGDGYSIEIAAYYNDFSNFIYQSPTGNEVGELPIFRYAASGAEQWGIEGEANIRLARLGEGELIADVVGDYVRVTIEDVGPAPFIPPLRVLGGLEYQSDALNARAEVEHVTGQDRIAAFETTTPAFTLANARVEWRPMGRDGLLTLRLAANNIFDVTARRHASFLKDYAPLPGRDLRIGASVRF